MRKPIQQIFFTGVTMKARVVVGAILAVIACFVVNYATGGENSVALAIKVVQDVSHKTATVDWSKAKKGDVLYSGDQVRTGERSIAIVKFKDNSMLRVRENSELKLFGEDKDGKFSKTVHVDRGEFSFDIEKQQQNEQFTFTSPTSVASIRGTQGFMQSNQGEDFLTVIDGLVNLLNTFSNNSVNVGSGQTGFSRPDGTIDVRQATNDEKNRAEREVRAGQGTGTEKSLDIELQDNQGRKSLMRIRYRD